MPKRSSALASAFTLVELLVVIGIISLLISILLPSLTKARAAATRAQCLSNQRQLASALYIYQGENRGYFPPQYLGAESYVTNMAYHPIFTSPVYTGGPGTVGRGSAEGYVALGYLIRSRQIKDGRAFYCPEMNAPEFQYDAYRHMWDRVRSGDKPHDTNGLLYGYLYRIYRSVSLIGSIVSAPELERLNKMRVGKFKGGSMALISDMILWPGWLLWPHVRPYGLCVAYSDGHAEFVGVRPTDYEVVRYLTTLTRMETEAYSHFVFFAIDRRDFPFFSEKARAGDWAALKARYGGY
jgi:prepilin-type N-terminal cleavage/methylation domain-containing protein